jgi:small conductance mechanosensitive channel
LRAARTFDHFSVGQALQMPWTFGRNDATESDDSAQAGHQLRERAAQRARAARVQLVAGVPLLAGIFVARHFANQPGARLPVRIATVALVVILGFLLSRSLARSLHPTLLKRLDTGAAGTVDFLIRLGGIVLALVVALQIAGVKPSTLAVGGAMTAVVVGMAAQQTLGNLFAGMVLLSARPFRVGERVRVKTGSLGGGTEGVVRSIGLFYTTLSAGSESIAVPNSVVVASGIVPLHDPAAVEIRARLDPGVKPTQLQTLLEESVRTPVRGEPYIDVEEIQPSEVVMRVAATPEKAEDGARLADEILEAVGGAMATA